MQPLDESIDETADPTRNNNRLILFFLWIAFYGSFTLLTPPLLDDADSVHAEVAREMLLRHDWVTLYANGIRYLEKAPLPYWIVAADIRTFGCNAFAVHLPQAIAVLLLMLLYYRRLALVVIAGIAVSASLIWSMVTMFNNFFVLTLAGVTGIVVSIGVTVDSYVVFFERLRDEMRGGRTLRNSAQRGFAAAWRTILAADFVSLLGAIVLWYLSVGSVRGFALFLGLSTICDMVVAYFFTRPAVILLSRRKSFQGGMVLGIQQVEAKVSTGGAA